MTKVTHKSHTTGDAFSNFFLSASKKEKTAIFIKAAKKANKDQRDLVKNLKP